MSLPFEKKNKVKTKILKVPKSHLFCYSPCSTLTIIIPHICKSITPLSVTTSEVVSYADCIHGMQERIFLYFLHACLTLCPS